MKVEGWLFSFIAAFLVVMTVVYGVLSKEWVGTTCLALSTGMAFMIGFYLLFTARRMDERPEDRGDAEIAEGAGEMGFFSPHSWWPLFLAIGVLITALGMIFGLFLLLIGAAVLLIALSGLLFEYYVGVNRTQARPLSEVQAAGELPTSPRKFLGE